MHPPPPPPLGSGDNPFLYEFALEADLRVSGWSLTKKGEGNNVFGHENCCPIITTTLAADLNDFQDKTFKLARLETREFLICL